MKHKTVKVKVKSLAMKSLYVFMLLMVIQPGLSRLTVTTEEEDTTNRFIERQLDLLKDLVIRVMRLEKKVSIIMDESRILDDKVTRTPEMEERILNITDQRTQRMRQEFIEYIASLVKVIEEKSK